MDHEPVTKYINIRFDTKEAPSFFYGKYTGPRRMIGERYGWYAVQFSTLAQAKKACEAYRKHVTKLGYVRTDINYADCVSADIGNHSCWNHLKLEELKASFFYLGA